MTSRERLEAAIWRTTGSALTAPQVDVILAEADKYAAAMASRFAAIDQAAGRHRLITATTEKFETAS